MTATTFLALVAVAGWIGAAGYAAHLAGRLHTDPLTGVGNRTALKALHRKYNHRCRRQLLGLLLLDLDRFKAVNDRYGHRTGDTVLVEVARRLSAVCGPGEYPIRLSGDEFVLWLGHLTDPATAERRARAVAADLATAMTVDGHRLVVTASVGTATGTAPVALEVLLGQADSGMYRAKHANPPRSLPGPPGSPRRRDSSPAA